MIKDYLVNFLKEHYKRFNGGKWGVFNFHKGFFGALRVP